MGDDLNIDFSGMKIFFGGQELKAVKEITIPPDVELSGDLSSGHIYKIPRDFTIKFQPKRRPRWRNIQKAYKLMGATELEIYTRGQCRTIVEKSGQIRMELRGEHHGH